MSSGIRVPLRQAADVADQLLGVLGLGCERIAVAGSIRCGREDVGDVELVAVPRIHSERLNEGFFEDREVLVDELQVVLDTLLMDGTLASHPDDPKRGPKYSKWIHAASGLQVDLFSARPETFGVIYIIRTGPESFARWLVTEAKARGHHVAGGELHKGSTPCDGRLAACSVVRAREEMDVFTALRMPFIEPARRG